MTKRGDIYDRRCRIGHLMELRGARSGRDEEQAETDAVGPAREPGP